MKRIRDIIFAACFCLCLLCAAFLTLRGGADPFLFYENRMRAEAPALTRTSLLDGSWFDGLETYLTDHAPLRTTLLTGQTWAELRLLRTPVISEVVITDNLLLSYKDYEVWELDYIEWLGDWVTNETRTLADVTEAYGGHYLYLGLPEMFSYFGDEYPAYMNNRQWYLGPTVAQFKADMAERNLRFVDAQAAFEAAGRPADYYYKTDHHFTFTGALAAYHALMDAIREETGFDHLPQLTEGLNLELVTLESPFLGSYGRKLYGLLDYGDRLVIGQPTEPVPFTREDDGAASEPFINRLPLPADYASYLVYMGGDQAETVIRTTRPELPSLLIYGDSYTNALETLLYWSFDETRSIDLRYYDKMSLAAYIELYQPDIVVCVRDDTSYLETSGNGNPLGLVRE